MQPSPSVSVIIPNYNHALYLKQRIESVLNQTHQDFELIILDDCSTDQSKTIIESYRNHPKVSHVLYNQQNSGSVFKQWIKGIELCQGDYIWIAESDDYASEFFLQETLSALLNDASLGMVFTKSLAVNEKGETINNTWEAKENRWEKLASFNNIIDKENLPLFLIAQMLVENASSVLFRKSQLLAINLEELSHYKNTGDRFTYIGIALNSKILYMPQPLNYMRWHEHNTTKKNIENGNIHRDRLRVLNFYFERLLHSPYKKELAVFFKNNYFFFMNYGTFVENLALLENIKKTKEISYIFYALVKGYLYLFINKKYKARILRSIYYRILLLQK